MAKGNIGPSTTWRTETQFAADLPADFLVSHPHIGGGLRSVVTSGFEKMVFARNWALFHEAPTECDGDHDCYQAALQSDLESFETIHWVSGHAHTDLSVDWVQALHRRCTNRYAFFGMSLRLYMLYEDIRAKDSYYQYR